MNERELADLFNSQWDAVQSGDAPRRGETPAEVRQALAMAGKVAQADFSTDSRSREMLRRRILSGAMYWEAASSPQPEARGRLVGLFQFAKYAAVISLFLLVLSLTLRAFLPRSQPGIPQASQVAAVPAASTPTESPALALAETETPLPPPPVLGLESLPETIQTVILNPAWETLWVQGGALTLSPEGEASTFLVQGWLDREGTGRVLSTDQLSGEVPFDLSLEPRWVWASDGQSLELYDHQTGQYDPTTEAMRWSSHPLEMAGLVVEMLFPRELAGNVADLKVVEYADQAGRPAVVIDWDGARYWVDSETGVILRRQRFDEAGNLVEDVAIQSIVYNPDLPENISSPDNVQSAPFEPAPTSQPGEIPSSPLDSQPGKPTLTPQEPPTPTPTPAAGDTILVSVLDAPPGEIPSDASQDSLYFTLRSTRPPFDRRLAQVDTACLFTQSACNARFVPGSPEAFDNQLHWSPDGSQAVLIDSTSSRLLRFEPNSGAFSILAEDFFATTDVALWSPDGAWVAMTVQDEQLGGSLITLVSPGELTSRSSLQTPTAQLTGIQVPLAWLDNHTLLLFRHATENKDGSGRFIDPGLYQLDLQRNQISKVPIQGAWEWLRNYPAASPDGSLLAVWTQIDGQGQLAVLDLNLVSPEGNLLTPLGVDGSSPTWSPDGKWIAFTASGIDEAGQPEVTVNLIHPDGSSLQQVFTWGTTPSVTWSPESKRLIITAYPLGQDQENDLTAFYLVTLPEGRQQRLVLEQLDQRYEFFAPAFRSSE